MLKTSVRYCDHIEEKGTAAKAAGRLVGTKAIDLPIANKNLS